MDISFGTMKRLNGLYYRNQKIAFTLFDEMPQRNAANLMRLYAEFL